MNLLTDFDVAQANDYFIDNFAYVNDFLGAALESDSHSLASHESSLSEQQRTADNGGDDDDDNNTWNDMPQRIVRTSSTETAPPAMNAFQGNVSPLAKKRARTSRRPAHFESGEWTDTADDDDEDDEPASPRSSKKKKRPSQAHNKSARPPSMFRGVSCCGNDRKWQARIRDGAQVHYLGRHDNQFSAALAYDEAARSLKGESAVPNFQVLVLECAQTREALRAHFAMHKRILPEFHHLLHPASLVRQKVE